MTEYKGHEATLYQIKRHLEMVAHLTIQVGASTEYYSIADVMNKIHHGVWDNIREVEFMEGLLQCETD